MYYKSKAITKTAFAQFYSQNVRI